MGDCQARFCEKGRVKLPPTYSTTDNPDFVAFWQKVEEALKCLDENQVERLYSKKHDFIGESVPL